MSQVDCLLQKVEVERLLSDTEGAKRVVESENSIEFV